jgi:uncharacterized protein YdaT
VCGESVAKSKLYRSFRELQAWQGIMPWYNGDYPPSYENQPKHLRDKAVEIANEILKESGDEGIAIATGLKKAREYFEEHPQEKDK